MVTQLTFPVFNGIRHAWPRVREVRFIKFACVHGLPLEIIPIIKIRTALKLLVSELSRPQNELKQRWTC